MKDRDLFRVIQELFKNIALLVFHLANPSSPFFFFWTYKRLSWQIEQYREAWASENDGPGFPTVDFRGKLPAFMIQNNLFMCEIYH